MDSSLNELNGWTCLNFKEGGPNHLNATNSQLHILHFSLRLLYPHAMKPHGIVTAINAQALILSALISHHLAGGALVSGQKLFLGYLAAYVMLKKSGLENLRGPRLALLISGVQSLGHFYFGMNTMSDLRMTFSHLFAGFLCYGFITKSREFVSFGFKLLRKYFSPSILQLGKLKRNVFLRALVFLNNYKDILLTSFLGMRAPPRIGLLRG